MDVKYLSLPEFRTCPSHRLVRLTRLGPRGTICIWQYANLLLTVHRDNCGAKLRCKTLFMCCAFLLCRVRSLSSGPHPPGRPIQSTSSAGSTPVGILCRCLSRELGARAQRQRRCPQVGSGKGPNKNATFKGISLSSDAAYPGIHFRLGFGTISSIPATCGISRAID